jgi:hypothetical protein
MFRTVFAPAPHMRLEHIPPVQERHLAVRLDPHLVARVRRNNGQRCDVEAEFARLCEFSETQAEGEEVFARDGRGEVGEGGTDVVDS